MITIKGLKQGLLVVFNDPPDTPWLTQLRDLETKLETNPKFFKGGSMAFDVRARLLSEEDLRQAIALLQSYQVTLWAVVSHNQVTCDRARALGLADRLTPSAPDASSPQVVQDPLQPSSSSLESLPLVELPMRIQPNGSAEAVSADGILVRRCVRSGQVLHHPGHIVVIGDVNPGAQLIAGGDIIVWGKLHGSAYAGALGDQNTVVCALGMHPSLIRIADVIYIPRSGERRRRGLRSSSAKIARVENQEVVFVDWNQLDRRVE
ncbi:MAG: septum site-determining protein MinC [Anaerolineae bacterium]|nr:septum site-determining protein MinC [Anaerolineae bacterium]